MNFTIGCDPELFLSVEGKFQSVHDLLPGEKRAPYFVENGAVQVDGVAAEFNIVPASTRLEFEFNIRSVRNTLDDLLVQRMVEVGRKPRGFSLVAEPVADFEPEYFDTLPEFSKLLGCEPDFNAYTGEQNEPPFTDLPFRTGAGHIHIGWGNAFDPDSSKHFEDCKNVTKQLDAVLYPVSQLWDKDERRRSLYGQKGSFRPKMYGVEYRPLSNAWLRSDDTINAVYEITMRAVDLLFNHGKKLYA